MEPVQPTQPAEDRYRGYAVPVSPKPWYQSKTIWVNGLVLALSVVLLVAHQFGLVEVSSIVQAIFVLLGAKQVEIDPVVEVGILTLVNIILRFATERPVTASPKN